jgi:hypothetical protein
VRRCVEAMYQYRPREALAAAECPVTLIAAGAATADDEDERERRLAIEDAQRVRAEAGRPALSVQVHEGVGHDLMRYRPAELAREVERLTSD